MIRLKKLIAFTAALFLATSQAFAVQAPLRHVPTSLAAHSVSRKSAPKNSPKPAYSKRAKGPRVVMVGKKKYLVAERYAANGRLLSTITIGDDYREIKTDRFGTDTADTWEVTHRDTTLRASSPFYGHFMRVDIEKRARGGRYLASLTYQPRTKKYQLVSKHFERYVVLNAEDDIVFGDKCSVSNTQNLDDFKALLKTMADSTQKDPLTCHIEAMAPLIFDKSCFTPDFKDSIEDMSKALAKVMDSESDTGSQGGKYLACLDKYGLAQHAANIQGFMFNRIDGANTALDEARYKQPAALTADQYASVRTPTEPSCGNDSTTQGLLATLSTSVDGGTKLIGCGAATNGADSDARRGSFTTSYGQQQVVMRATKDQIANVTFKKAFSNPVDAYASTMFHEFVHSSGIHDENLTLNIEQCCGGSDSNNAKGSCTKLQAILKPYAEAARLRGVLSLGFTKSSYADTSEYVNETILGNLSGGSAADVVMNSYESWVAPQIADDADARAKIKVNGVVCPTSGQSDACLKAQSAKAQEGLLDYTNQWLNKQCPAAVQTASSSSSPTNAADAKALCQNSDFRQHFIDMVTLGKSSSPIVNGQQFDVLGNLSSNASIISVTSAQALASLTSALDASSPVSEATNTVANIRNQGDGASTVDPADKTLASDLAMKPKPVQRGVAPVLDNTGGTNGASTDITAGAQPGTPGSPDGRNDFAAGGINYGTTVVDNAAKLVGIPSAQASTTAAQPPAADDQSADIVVTGRRLPTKQPKTAKVSDESSQPLNLPFVPTAAPIITKSSGSSDSSSSSTTPAVNFSTGSAPVISASSASTTTPILPSAVSDVPSTSSSSMAPIQTSAITNGAVAASGASTRVGSGAPSTEKPDGINRNPSSSSTPRDQDKAASAAGGARSVPTFTNPADMERYLEQDYTHLSGLLGKTKMNQQLIDYHIILRDDRMQVMGCSPSFKCQPKIKLNYCPRTHRLTRVGEC